VYTKVNIINDETHVVTLEETLCNITSLPPYQHYMPINDPNAKQRNFGCPGPRAQCDDNSTARAPSPPSMSTATTADHVR